MSRRALLVGPLALVVAATFAPLSVAAASQDGRSRTVHVSGTGVSDPNAPIGLSCDATGGRCLVSTLIPGSIAGDVQGATIGRGAAYGNLTTGDYFGSSVLMISGAVAGCGTGSFTVSLADFSGNLALPAAATGVVVPGSGTGELDAVSGRANFVFTPGQAGAGTYTYTMKLRCRRP
jgi:hypothetical protein